MLIRLTLEFSEHLLLEAENADVGLKLIQQHRPDIVLLDVMMPGEMNGLELCQRIKNTAELAHIKVIMLSAKGQKTDVEKGQECGADAYVVKPFSPTELMQLLAIDLDFAGTGLDDG
jgi:DNA-binding response OmpR family regulator